jgi:hypothetical protein
VTGSAFRRLLDNSSQILRHPVLQGIVNSKRGRSIEVDFFRGIVLMVIVIDHIPGSVLAHFTLHSYAFCDSADGIPAMPAAAM